MTGAGRLPYPGPLTELVRLEAPAYSFSWALGEREGSPRGSGSPYGNSTHCSQSASVGCETGLLSWAVARFAACSWTS